VACLVVSEKYNHIWWSHGFLFLIALAVGAACASVSADSSAAAWVCWARLTLRDPCQFSGGSRGGYFGFYQIPPMIVL
jgi:hypothetical protein